MSQEEAKTNPVFLLFGKTGWLGGVVTQLLRDQGKTVHLAESRLQNREDVAKELDTIKPTHVLNAAGLTGRPNVDWCEDHKIEVIRVNVIGTLTLSDLCETRGIHCTHFATGCIYKYDEEHKIGGKPFTEEDKPNFAGSYYSKTKAMVEDLLREYSKVLVLRVRMPISDDLIQRNFITKITRYAKVVNIPNSMTVLTDMLPMAITMAENNLTGVYNYTNPGAISHNQILDLYTKYIDPNFKYENFTEEEQNKILKAERSNNELDSTKFVAAMEKLGVKVPDIHEAIVGVFKRMRKNLGLKDGEYYTSPGKI